MTPRLAALLALALASGARAEVRGALSLGAGYDLASSRDAAEGPLPDTAFSTVHAQLTAEAGPDAPFPEGLALALAYDGLRVLDVDALTLDRPSLTLSAFRLLGTRAGLKLAATAAWRRLSSSGSAAAQGWEAGGAATVVRLVGGGGGEGARLKVAAGWRAYGGEVAPGWIATGRLSLHLTPWRGAELALSGGGSAGVRELLALPSAPVPSSDGALGGAAAVPSAVPEVFGDGAAPADAALRTVTGGVELSQRLGAGLSLTAGWAWTRTVGDLPTAESHLGWLEVGWEW